MKIFKKIFWKIYLRFFIEVKKGKCLFIPHPGFRKNDKASIINYKGDNCLIFVRYLLDNNLYQDKELVVVSSSPENASREQQYCSEHYPLAKIKIIPDVTYSSKDFKLVWAESELIISSEECFSFKKKKGQRYICLSYYPISLKNDCYNPQTAYMGYRAKKVQDVDMIVSSSLINSQIEAAAFEVSFYKFKTIGKVRSDVLLQPEDITYVRDYFKRQCNEYDISKIILYTPTHRDYERSSFDIKRSILGFDVNKEQFEIFLRKNHLLIVCKLHPNQNAAIVDSDMPHGVVRFEGSAVFGLIELMKASDMLITDYTSTYVDYLLLKKPVLFNFYDLEMYEKSRGLAFYPFEKICAGEIFTDEESFYNAVEATLLEPDRYSSMRDEVTEHLNTYHNDVCEKTYKLVFGE